MVEVQKQQIDEHSQQLSHLHEALKQTMLGACQKLQKDIFREKKEAGHDIHKVGPDSINAFW